MKGLCHSCGLTFKLDDLATFTTTMGGQTWMICPHCNVANDPQASLDRQYADEAKEKYRGKA